MMSDGGYQEGICNLRARSWRQRLKIKEGLVCRVRSLEGEGVGKPYRDGEVGCREADTASSEKGMMNAFPDTSNGSKKGKQSGFEPVL